MIAAIPLPYRLLIGAVGVAAVAGYAYWLGASACEQEYEAARAVELATYLDELNKETARGNAIAKEFAEYKAKSARTRVANTAHTTSLAPCGNPPSDVVRLHDAAAKGETLPATASGAACTPSTAVDHRHLAATVVENYGACNEYIEQLNALIDWHERGSK